MSASDETATGVGGELPRWGRYILRFLIGEGKQGAVYCAWDPQLECDVALKVVRQDSPDTLVSDSILREARALARVRHANVVNVYGVETHEGKVGICMELVKGRTLEDVLKSNGRFGAQEAINVGLAVGRALAAVHAAGLVHRDVKARNVMRDHTGRFVLMDFGLGRDRSQLRALSGEITGTPLYMAPELFEDGSASPRTDVYSAGVLLYHLVTDAYPVEGRTFEDVVKAHRQGLRTPLVERRPDLPEDFVRVVGRAIASKPDDRYESPAHLVHDLVTVGRQEFPAPEPRTFLQRLASGAIVVASAVVGVTLLGFITSSAFNVTLERTAFASESPLDWTIWGLRSLIAPILNIAQLLLIPVAVVVLWRLVRRVVKPVDRWSRRVLESLSERKRRLGLDSPQGIVHLAAGLGLVYLLVFALIQWPLISTLIWDWQVVSALTPQQVALLSPANKQAHLDYRWPLDWLVLGTGWMLWRTYATRRARADVGASPIVALAATLMLAVVLWAAPYRLFFQSERPRMNVNGERCYDLGRRNGEMLIYCPDAPQPKVRRVTADDPGVRDTGMTESVFTVR